MTLVRLLAKPIGAGKAHLHRRDLRDRRPLGSSKGRGHRLSKEVARPPLTVPSAGSGEATRSVGLLGALVRKGGTGTTKQPKSLVERQAEPLERDYRHRRSTLGDGQKHSGDHEQRFFGVLPSRQGEL